MKKNFLSLVLILFGTLFVSNPALAQGPFGSPGEPRGGNPEHRLFEQLDLTDAQKEQIRAIREKERADSKPFIEQLGQLHQSMGELVFSDTFNESAVKSIIAQQGQVNASLGFIRAKAQFDVYQVLTPEQKAKLKELLQNAPYGKRRLS